MNMIASKPRQIGFSLVEVLVAVAVFSLGLGGLSLMLLSSARGSVEAQNQTTAILQAASLAELILLNPAAKGHFINPAGETSADCVAPEACNKEAWAAGNLARWQYELQQNLAQATGLACLDATPDDGHTGEPACDGAGHTVVKVFWAEARHLEPDDGGLRRVVLPVAE